jgi:hypothetical protein
VTVLSLKYFFFTLLQYLSYTPFKIVLTSSLFDLFPLMFLRELHDGRFYGTVSTDWNRMKVAKVKKALVWTCDLDFFIFIF